MNRIIHVFIVGMLLALTFGSSRILYAKDIECIGEWDRDQITGIISEDDFNSYLKIFGIKSICLPNMLGLPSVHDWNNVNGPVGTGRKIRMSFFDSDEGWRDVSMEYSTYDFTLGTEYETYATYEDYMGLKHITEGYSVIGSNKALVHFRQSFNTINDNSWYEKRVIIPYEYYNVAFILKLKGDYSDDSEPSYATEPDLETFDKLVSSVEFRVSNMGVFLDIPSSHPNSDAISYVKDHNIVEGYEDGTYKPDNLINRAEFTKILIGASEFENNTSASHCFPDVESEWFASYVCTAKSQNIIAGHPDGTFHPANNINTAEAAKIVVKTFKLPIQEIEGDWYKPFIAALVDANAIPTIAQDPSHLLTRGEMAEIIWKVSQYNF